MKKYFVFLSCIGYLIGIIPSVYAQFSQNSLRTNNVDFTSKALLPCTTTFLSPLKVSIRGTLEDIIISPNCKYVFATNTTRNQVEVISLKRGILEAPIRVGSQPKGLDLNPTGDKLYVANSGGNNISVVDLKLRREIRKIIVPPDPFSNDTPFSIAIAANNIALFSTTFLGTGFGARMMQLNIVTDKVKKRGDFWLGGSTTEVTILKPSLDRQKIGVIAGDISSGPVFTYSTATNKFSPEKDLNTFNGNISVDGTGSTFLVNPGTFVLDSKLNVSGTIPISGFESFGTAVAPSGNLGYRATGAGVEILKLKSFLRGKTLPLPDSLSRVNGRMAISGDGSLLAVITDKGISLLKTQ